MKFAKMQGTGNDFICVDCFREKIVHPHSLARRLCDRHFGIGADGLLLLLPSAAADCRMELYNRDGSAAGMCGNGLRCAGAYLNAHLLPQRQEMIIETRAGLKRLWKKEGGYRVDMEAPRLEAHALPVLSERGLVIEEAFSVEGKTVTLTCVSMGNPHAVCFVEKTEEAELELLGRALEHHHRFPEGVNTEFVEIVDEEHLKVGVWERGCGETMACGTGACAAVVAGALTGRCGRSASVRLPGGTLTVEWEQGGPVFLEGPAEEVFSGEIPAV